MRTTDSFLFYKNCNKQTTTFKCSFQFYLKLWKYNNNNILNKIKQTVDTVELQHTFISSTLVFNLY